MAILKPSPSPPTRFSSGTHAFSNSSCPVGEPRIPILCSSRPTWNPGASASTTKHEIPRVPAFGSVTANTVYASATPALVIQFFTPLSFQPPSTRSAVVRIAPGSDPASGSDNPNAAIHSPLANRGSTRPRNSSPPASLTGSAPRSCTASIRDEDAHTHAISSIAMHSVSAPVPVPPCSTSNGSPNRSCEANSSWMSMGYSPDASMSLARGATRS